MVSLASPGNFLNSWKRQGAGRTLTSTYGKLGLPLDVSRALARKTKICLAPVEYVSRRVAAKTRIAKDELRVSKVTDYAILQADQVPDLAKLKQHCESVFEKFKDAALSAQQAPFPLFRFDKTPLGPRAVDVEDMRPIVDFLCQPELVAMAKDYIGETPVLGNICLWYSRVNSDRVGPQLIHRDMNCKRQLHLVIPLRTVDMGTGPFTFLPGDQSRAYNRAVGYVKGRVDDAEFFKTIDPSRMIPFTSEKGAVLVVNPYECFHFGGRAATSPRFVLICSYTSLFENAEEGLGTYRLVNRDQLSDGSRERNELLNLVGSQRPAA
jgi:hypothetical protein